MIKLTKVTAGSDETSWKKGFDEGVGAQIERSEQEANDKLAAEYKKWEEAAFKAELLIKQEAVKVELRKVKAEIEREFKLYHYPLIKGTRKTHEYTVSARDIRWSEFWKGKGIE